VNSVRLLMLPDLSTSSEADCAFGWTAIFADCAHEVRLFGEIACEMDRRCHPDRNSYVEAA